MLLYLHRDSSVRVFLAEEFADAPNNLLTWIIVGFVFVLSLSTLISQMVPVVPNAIRRLQLFGYELNKFGFTFWVLLLFFTIRSLFTYLFLSAAGAAHRWPYVQFAASKFYFIVSVVVMITTVVHYYFNVDPWQAYDYYFGGFLVILLMKIALYIASPQHILPIKWYYKFLYICTLQIAPVLAVWSVLYF